MRHRSSAGPLRSPLVLVLAGLLLAACSKSADDRMAYARLYEERGDAARAIVEWTAALEDAPDRVDLLLGRGRAHSRCRDYESARRDFARALEVDPAAAEPRFLIAESWRDERRYDEALTATRGLDAFDAPRAARLRGNVLRARASGAVDALLRDVDTLAPPGRDRFWRALGAARFDEAAEWLARPDQRRDVRDLGRRLQAVRDDLSRARDELEQAAQGPRGGEATCDLAELDVLLRRPDAAEARLEAVAGARAVAEPATIVRARRILAGMAEEAGRYDAAVSHVDAAMQLRPDDLDLAFTRGMLCLRAGRPADAEHEIERISKDRHRKAQLALLRGVLLLSRGEARRAVPELQFVAASAPDLPLAHLWLGLALASAEPDSTPALAAFRKAVDLDPRSYVAHLARATAALRMGWVDVSVDHARRCTELEPERAPGWLSLGKALVRRAVAERDTSDREARFQEAAAALGEALRLDPRGMTGQEALAMRCAVTGQTGESIDALRTILGDGDDPDVATTLGALLAAEQRLDEAEGLLRATHAANPDHVRTGRALASVLASRGDVAGAESVLRAVIAAAPASGDAYSALVETLAAGGRRAEARAVLRGAATRAASDPQVQLLRLGLALRDGDFAEAESACVAGLVAEPGARAFHQVGILAALRGDLAVARARLDVALARFPQDVGLLAARALVAGRQGEREIARASARAAHEHAATDVHVLAAGGVALALCRADADAAELANAARSLPEGARRAVARHADLAASSRSKGDALADLHLVALLVAASPGAALGDQPTAAELRAELLARDDAASAADLVLLDVIGTLRLARGDAEGASQMYTQVLAAEPALTGAREKLAWLRAARGDEEGALAEAQRALRDGRASSGGHALVGALLEKKGELEESRRHFARAAELDPEPADELTSLGLVCERLGDIAGARQAYESALSHAPGLATPNARLASLIVDAAPERAEALARRAVGAAPNGAYARGALGLVLARTGRCQEALAELAKAVRAAPDDADLWALQGVAAMQAGRFDEARSHLRRANELDGGRAPVHLHLGMLSERGGGFDEARTHYERALELDPCNAVAMNNLASVLERTDGDLQRACALAEEAVRRTRGAAAALDTFGWVLHRLGRHEDAVRELRAAVAASPEDPSARWHLAAALHAAGERKESLRELDRLRDVGDFPERAAAEDLRRRLAAQ